MTSPPPKTEASTSRPKANRLVAEDHVLLVGWDVDTGHRLEDRRTLNNGVLQLADFGTQLSADTRKFSYYAQDDWTVSPHWSVNMGYRLETAHVESLWAGRTVQSDYSAGTPSSIWLTAWTRRAAT